MANRENRRIKKAQRIHHPMPCPRLPPLKDAAAWLGLITVWAMRERIVSVRDMTFENLERIDIAGQSFGVLSSAQRLLANRLG